MVVVSESWVKNVSPHVPANKDVVLENNENMGAQAVLICRPNSLHFQERILSLDQPVEVSRAVGRAKPTSTNAIFDCKVLSKHHALLWYDNGKFYIQDTKSSNGTFVNSNRLSPEVYEIHSGDIIQFGVDVVECNRKVTHGCIIAIVRLYLPDGVMVKANPCIADEETHVPLGDLYKLNQYLQEANKREPCLESKLDVLQHVVEEAKRATEESWQAYVGEERLLSRLSALETQLQHAKTNWSEDRFKEEIAKLRENNERYQEATKEALEKVHVEKQQAIVLAMEQERAKISAEQDALLARDQLNGAQLEIQEIVQKLREIQTKAEEEKLEYERQIKELEQHMEEEEVKIIDLESKIYDLTLEVAKKHSFSVAIEQRPKLIFDEDDLKAKEEIIAENEMSELNKSNSNGYDENHISLTVAPVEKSCGEEKTEDLEFESITKNYDEESQANGKDNGKRVSFKREKKDASAEESQNNLNDSCSPCQEIQADSSDFVSDGADSKTLKYQYQSAQREQNDLRRKIAILEKNSETNQAKILELNQSLNEEKELSGSRLVVCEKLKEELMFLEEKWKESNIENKKLLQRVNELVICIDKKKESETRELNMEKETACTGIPPNEAQVQENMPEASQTGTLNTVPHLSASINHNSCSSILSNEELTNIEEELVLFKEKYAQSCEDKLKLQKDLLKLRVQYNMMCDSLYNKYFWYIGPLVIIVIYLLIREWIS
uniref:FHA domain-containing protein n=1 Tax=Dendroctonus ponderosae TaxID=77166 RepID=A0AAR5PGI2_DENPD